MSINNTFRAKRKNSATMLAQCSSETCYQKVRVNLLGLLPLKTYLILSASDQCWAHASEWTRRHFPKAGICYSISVLYTNTGQIADWMQTAIWTSLWGVWATLISISLLWYCTQKTSVPLLWGPKRLKIAAGPGPAHKPLWDWGAASPPSPAWSPHMNRMCTQPYTRKGISSKQFKMLFLSLTRSSISVLNIKINLCSLEKY